MAKATAAAPDVSEAAEASEHAAAQAPSATPTGPLTRASILFLQRHAGNAAVARLLRPTAAQKRVLQRDYADKGAPGSRPNLDVGDTGPGVELLQQLLGAKVTGSFDAQTRKAVDEFQREQGWDPSGVGPETWKRIDGHDGSPGNRPNIKLGSRGPGVALLQRILGVKQTGYFGAATRAAVDDFQRAQGWSPTGVGPQTWARLDAKLVADQMGKMADPASPTQAQWHWSGAGTYSEPGVLPSGYATHFAEWASAAAESAFTVGPSTVINCWEMVLYAAYRAGDLTWKWIHDIYTYGGGSWDDEMARRLTPKGRTSFDRAHQRPKPNRGDIVLFDGIAHVALATGSGTQTYTFWPPPNVHVRTAISGGTRYVVATPDKVKQYSIEALAKECDDPPRGHQCVVEFGAPPWG